MKPLDSKITHQAYDAWKERKDCTVRITVQGKLLIAKVLRPPITLSCQKPTGTYTSFSRAARLRMLKCLARIDFTKVGNPLFITLTYPNREQPLTRKELNMHRFKFFRELEKKIGKQVAAIWRVEWVTRKTGEHTGKVYPHFHIILMTTQFLGHMVINAAWKKAIGEEKYVRTDTEAMANERQAVYYVAKYCAKVESPSLVNGVNLNIPSGKDWGVHRRNLLPLATKEVFECSLRGTLWASLLEMVNDPEAAARSGGESFTLLGDMVEEAMKIVRSKFPLDGKGQGM